VPLVSSAVDVAVVTTEPRLVNTSVPAPPSMPVAFALAWDDTSAMAAPASAKLTVTVFVVVVAVEEVANAFLHGLVHAAAGVARRGGEVGLHDRPAQGVVIVPPGREEITAVGIGHADRAFEFVAEQDDRDGLGVGRADTQQERGGAARQESGVKMSHVRVLQGNRIHRETADRTGRETRETSRHGDANGAVES
jgi:hypothetical protein